MADITPTTPGLQYDPRNDNTTRFFQALQKDLKRMEKMMAKNRGPLPKPKDYQKSQPLPDPGLPATLNMPNPRFKGMPGFAFSV